jgi:hypothetical protein
MSCAGNIEALRGTVTLASTPGQGSTHRDPAAADAGHHRRLPGRRGRLALHLPARCGRRGGGAARAAAPAPMRAAAPCWNCAARRCRWSACASCMRWAARAKVAAASSCCRPASAASACRGQPARPAPDGHQAAGPHVPQPARAVRLVGAGHRRGGADLRRARPRPDGHGAPAGRRAPRGAEPARRRTPLPPCPQSSTHLA